MVSAALKRDMRNPRAHEAAALVLGSFRTARSRRRPDRSAMGPQSDDRAPRGRPGASQRPIGAESSTGSWPTRRCWRLTNRQRTADRRARCDDADDAGRSPRGSARCASALTDDWRPLAMPSAATRIEKLEYFRARRQTVRAIRGGAGAHRHARADRRWISRASCRADRSASRTDSTSSWTALGARSTSWPMSTGSSISEICRGTPARESSTSAPAGCLAGGTRRWCHGAHGRSSRSVTSGCRSSKIDRSQSAHARAVPNAPMQFKQSSTPVLRHLTLYPIASVGRTKGKKGTEADLRYIDRAIDVAVRVARARDVRLLEIPAATAPTTSPSRAACRR